MATITKLTKIELDQETKHTDVEGTYAIVEAEGKKYLQIDTYGSAIRKFPGKKSQSLRFNQEAVDQLKHIIDKEFKKS